MHAVDRLVTIDTSREDEARSPERRRDAYRQEPGRVQEWLPGSCSRTHAPQPRRSLSALRRARPRPS
jgi:hypothetical protein